LAAAKLAGNLLAPRNVKLDGVVVGAVSTLARQPSSNDGLFVSCNKGPEGAELEWRPIDGQLEIDRRDSSRLRGRLELSVAGGQSTLRLHWAARKRRLPVGAERRAAPQWTVCGWDEEGQKVAPVALFAADAQWTGQSGRPSITGPLWDKKGEPLRKWKRDTWRAHLEPSARRTSRAKRAAPRE